MSMLINGNSGCVEQPIRYRYDNQRGWTVVRCWKGTKGAIQAMLPQFTGNGWSLEMGSDTGASWMITASTSTADDPNGDSNIVNDWSFLPGTAEKAILHADTPIINGLTSDEINAIQTSINNNDRTYPAKTTKPDGSDGVAMSANAINVWLLMKSGQTSVEITAPVIRHTRTVSNLYTVKAASTYAGQIMTTAQIISYETPPASILVDLPAQVYGGILPLKYGWKKRWPEKTQSAYNRINLIQEWHYGLWETLTNVFAVIP